MKKDSIKTIDLKNLTIKSAHSALIGGDYTVRELCEAYLSEIKKKDGDIHAYLEVYDDVLKQADEAQKKVSSKNMLAGIPMAIKDNILIEGRRAGSASKILEGYIAPYDATVIKKLKKAGVVFIGRTNMDEFAMGSSTENSAYGVTKNPHDMGRVAGGSSGGSAAAVGGGLVLAGLGSDTGGSVRQPASYCGIVGLKPTYGSISRHGLMAMGSSLDVIGPLTKTVTDAEILFNCMKGKDRYDSTSIDVDIKDSSSKILGVPRHFLKGDGIDSAVMKSFERSIEKFKSLGYQIRDIELPNIEYSLAVYYILMPAEASTNLSRFDGVKYGLHREGKNLLEDYLLTRAFGFGREARRRIMLGTYVLSSGYYDAYYNKATAVRELLKSDFARAFQTVDAILTPTAPAVAFKIGEKMADPVSMYLEDIFTVTANLVGVPAISIPAGSKDIGSKQLPIGFQIIASHGREDILFALGKQFLNES
ncbi:MAG: Asp-tRNA(Asn)/Glu-tRNA(Gln) amidotransferase subunit GatA [Patescibacteria group bacterium]